MINKEKAKADMHAHMDKATPAIDKFERASIVNQHMKTIDQIYDSLIQDLEGMKMEDDCYCEDLQGYCGCKDRKKTLKQVINLLRNES